MKKIKFQKKLSLNKETITKLNDEQMNQVKGGTGSRSYHYCIVDHPLNGGLRVK